MTDIPLQILKQGVHGQVSAYDERFAKGLKEAREAAANHVNAAAQVDAFGKRDATGIEAVHDMMPTERDAFERLLEGVDGRRPGAAAAQAVEVLDFGCGDGRYLQQYVRSAEVLAAAGRGELRVVAYEVSVEALRSFHFHALQIGSLAAAEDADAEASADAGAGLRPLRGGNLHLQFVLGSGHAGTEEVGELLRSFGPIFDIVVVGWGTLSSIPRVPLLSPESLLACLAPLGRVIMNVASTTNNHVSFQRKYEALRRALAETDRENVRAYLQAKIMLACFPGSYYYKVDTGQLMFYAAITADQEGDRLEAAGFDDVRLRICNVINFFDIQTKPRAERINSAVIRLLERGNVWGAQLLLSRCMARAYGKPLASLNTTSCIFDGSSRNAVMGQVARYFISTGVSRSLRPGA